VIEHRCCPICGVHLFGERADPARKRRTALDVRRLERVGAAALPLRHFDGRRF
jgi:hypothetical protein